MSTLSPTASVDQPEGVGKGASSFPDVQLHIVG